MNKKMVDKLLPYAYEVLKEVKIADMDNKIESGFTGQIAAFGASMVTGSVLATIAFFSNNKGAAVDRTRLLRGMERLLVTPLGKMVPDGGLFDYVKGEINRKNEKKVKEELINCAVALKLAMNLYTLEKMGGEPIEP